MTAGDVTAEMIADLQFQIMQGSEGPMQERHETQFRQQVVADLLAALEASRAEASALRRQLEERGGRSSIQDPADSDLDSVLYDVGGDTGNEFQRRLIRYGVEWARDHFAPSESASREQCDRIAQMLADNPLNRMCDADSDPSPDVVAVPREEWDELVAELQRLQSAALEDVESLVHDVAMAAWDAGCETGVVWCPDADMSKRGVVPLSQEEGLRQAREHFARHGGGAEASAFDRALAELRERLKAAQVVVPEMDCPRVEQTRLHNPPESTGNCFSAVLAGLLNLPIESIPEFDNPHWRRKVNVWLRQFGLAWIQVEDLAHFRAVYGIEGMWHEIAGASPRDADVLHAVAGKDGEVEWDPHPSQAGLANMSDGHGIFIALRPWELASSRFRIVQPGEVVVPISVLRTVVEDAEMRTPEGAASWEHLDALVRARPTTEKEG